MKTPIFGALVVLSLAGSLAGTAQATTDLGAAPQREASVPAAPTVTPDWFAAWLARFSQRAPGRVISSNVMAMQLASSDPGLPPGSNLNTVPGGNDVPLAGVPEPAVWLMLIAGFGLVGGVARGRRGVITA